MKLRIEVPRGVADTRLYTFELTQGGTVRRRFSIPFPRSPLLLKLILKGIAPPHSDSRSPESPAVSPVQSHLAGQICAAMPFERRF